MTMSHSTFKADRARRTTFESLSRFEKAAVGAVMEMINKSLESKKSLRDAMGLRFSMQIGKKLSPEAQRYIRWSYYDQGWGSIRVDVTLGRVNITFPQTEQALKEVKVGLPKPRLIKFEISE